jgi:hypothetical protein
MDDGVDSFFVRTKTVAQTLAAARARFICIHPYRTLRTDITDA